MELVCLFLTTVAHAIELGAVHVALKRAQLRRADPSASEKLIAERLSAWLRTRAGALHGASEGVLRANQGETA
jgi:Rv0078B-related antitoxin